MFLTIELHTNLTPGELSAKLQRFLENDLNAIVHEIAAVHKKPEGGVLNPQSVSIDAARHAKSSAMAILCHGRGMSVERVKRFSDLDWQLIAQQAKVKPPNSQETKNLVYELLGKLIKEKSK
jgi:hypothetical protein